MASPLAPPCVPNEFPKLSKDQRYESEAGPVQAEAGRQNGEPDGAKNWVTPAEEPVGGSENPPLSN